MPNINHQCNEWCCLDSLCISINLKFAHKIGESSLSLFSKIILFSSDPRSTFKFHFAIKRIEKCCKIYKFLGIVECVKSFSSVSTPLTLTFMASRYLHPYKPHAGFFAPGKIQRRKYSLNCVYCSLDPRRNFNTQTTWLQKKSFFFNVVIL